MKRGNKPVWKKILSSPFTLIAAVILFAALARAVYTIHMKAAASLEKLAEAQSELLKLKSHQADLAAEVDRLSSPAGVEAELRTKYRAVKAGESVAVIVDDQTAAVEAATSTAVVSESWLQGLTHLLGF